MADHIVTVSDGGGIRLFLKCSSPVCVGWLAMIDRPEATLAELAEIADEHIRTAERNAGQV